MKKLTDKELAIMNVLWDNGALSMRDLLERMPEPRPNFNTLTTFVRRLEVSGMIKHQELGARFFLYEPAVSRDNFNGSYKDFISCLVQQQEVSIDDLRDLIRMAENAK